MPSPPLKVHGQGDHFPPHSFPVLVSYAVQVARRIRALERQLEATAAPEILARLAGEIALVQRVLDRIEVQLLLPAGVVARAAPSPPSSSGDTWWPSRVARTRRRSRVTAILSS